MNSLGFITPPCCAHPSIANMDHIVGHVRPFRPMVNRMCTRCGQHWYGNDGTNVVEFTRAAWDRWMNSAFDEDRAAAQQVAA